MKFIVKKIVNLLSIVALIAFSFACNQPATEGETNSTEEVKSIGSNLNIAYVLTDSVINRYDYFKLRSDEISEKGKKFEGELQTRARGFEQEVANFQQSAQSMTMNQARAKEEELVKKEQNLMTYRNNLMQELSADEATLYNEVYEKIQTFMKSYAEENNLDLIMSYSRGGAMWYANEGIDVTESVIDGLNKSYNSNSTDSLK